MVSKNPKFDLNKHPADFSSNDEVKKDSCLDDTTLRLQCFGHVTQQDTKNAPKDGCGLVLGLGPTSRMNERDLVLKLGLSDHQSSFVEVSNEFGFDHVVDEGATSSKSSGGYMPSLILAPRISVPLQKLRISEPEPSFGSYFWTKAALDNQPRGKKAQGSEVRCSHPTGCKKEARGKSGLCVNHVGGKRFVVEGCARSAEGQGADRRYCVRDCTKGAQGSSMFCKVHGGGSKGAGGSTLLCKAHRGGKRCLYDGGSNPGPVSPDKHLLSGPIVVLSSTCSLGKSAKRRQMIPPQVLVPSSMKSSSSWPFARQSNLRTDGNRKSLELVAPNDQVHGSSQLWLVEDNQTVIDETLL